MACLEHGDQQKTQPFWSLQLKNMVRGRGGGGSAHLLYTGLMVRAFAWEVEDDLGFRLALSPGDSKLHFLAPKRMP